MLLLLLLLAVLSCWKRAQCLHCVTNCSLNLTMSEPFAVPSDCQLISANRCSVKLRFWYDRQTYSLLLTGETSYGQSIDDNRQFLLIETATNGSFFYDVHHVCKEADDCARHFAERKIAQMTKRSYNLSGIFADLRPLLYDRFALSRHLACFDASEAVRQCTTPGLSGSCQIIDDLIKSKFHRRLCLHNNRPSASVSIYDAEHYAMMTLKCNRMLCNGPLTAAAVKRVLAFHNVTDANGRLTANSLRTRPTRCLLALMIVLCVYLRIVNRPY